MGKIRLFELEDSLATLITSIANKKMKMESSTTELTTVMKEIPIDISTYNKEKDILLVFENSVFINNTTDYVINDNNTISLVNGESFVGTPEQPTIFNFIVLKSITNKELDIKPDGSLLLDNSIQENKLSKDLINKINSKNTGIYSVKLESTNWTPNETTGLYETTITHNLNKENIFVNGYTLEGDEIVLSRKIIDNNTIKLSSLVNYTCNIKILSLIHI